MLEIEPEDNKLRRKRPERQLYVPPQRRSSLNESGNQKHSARQRNHISNKNEEKVIEEQCYEKSDAKANEISFKNNDHLPPEIAIIEFLLCSFLIQSRWKCMISGTRLKFQSNVHCQYEYQHALMDNLLPVTPLIYFYNKRNYPSFYEDQNDYFYINTYPFYSPKNDFQYTIIYDDQIPTLVINSYQTYSIVIKQFDIFCDSDMYSVEDTIFIDNSYKYYPYLHIILDGILLKKKQSFCIFDTFDNMLKFLNSPFNLINNKENASASNKITKPNPYNNIKKTVKNISNTSHEIIRKKKDPQKTNHEEEVEIMRKTQEHINRKTRPIMKYLGESNDTLKIDDGIKSWEDLLDDEGEVKEDLISVNKVTKSRKCDKCNNSFPETIAEDVKHIEELEHLVELYDFPSSFKTQDLIQAFSNIDCDAMYIKWVDDTHAILVLGTLTQATKAINMKNPLIKVRSMATASKNTLIIANQNELKPAMKRPPTNLQTARRFITAALGTKIGVSQERMAKERADLKAAREMKKLMKKNERDAWEGNLQSSLH